MPSVTSDHGVVHLGLDVHKNTISAGVLEPGADTAVVDKISSDEDAVRRLVGRFDDPGRVRACYEAGPTGYELARLLRSLGVRCEVIAPSLIPTAPGDRVKTDLLTELPGRCGGREVRGPAGLARFPRRDQRRGCAAGAVRAGGAAGRVA